MLFLGRVLFFRMKRTKALTSKVRKFYSLDRAFISFEFPNRYTAKKEFE
jgi:hypothetical protein